MAKPLDRAANGLGHAPIGAPVEPLFTGAAEGRSGLEWEEEVTGVELFTPEVHDSKHWAWARPAGQIGWLRVGRRYLSVSIPDAKEREDLESRPVADHGARRGRVAPGTFGRRPPRNAATPPRNHHPRMRTMGTENLRETLAIMEPESGCHAPRGEITVTREPR